MRRISRKFALVFALFVPLLAAAQSLPPQVQSGLGWLQQQVQADGSVSGAATSVAQATQVRAETLHALASMSTGAPSLVEGFATAADTTTVELQSRAMLALAASGANIATRVAALRALQNPDGGFGAEPDYSSDTLDTALALLALRAGGVKSDTDAARAIGYLTSAGNADGSYGGNGPRVYETALALIALKLYSREYVLDAAISRTRSWLIGAQAGGVYADVVENAHATLALVAAGADATAYAGAKNALLAAQSADGSWSNDPYLTAISLRALGAAVATPVLLGGTFTGVVIDGATGGPLMGATVRIAALNLSTTVDTSGRFVLANVPAGSYTLAIERSGYASAGATAGVAAGATTNIGTVLLQPITTTSTLRGLVTDASSGAPLEGATIALSGASTATATTGSDGRYELNGLNAGAISIQVTRTGYQALSGTATLMAGGVSVLSPALLANGTDPVGTSLRGRVADASNGAAIVGATIATDGHSATSGSDGRFELNDLAAGPFDASVTAPGYAAANLSGSLVSGINDVGEVRLAPSSAPSTISLSGVVLSNATQQPIAGASVSINGAALATTDVAGAYRIDSIASLGLEFKATAVGYTALVETLSFSGYGAAVHNANLVPVASSSALQIVDFNAPRALTPGTAVDFSAQVAALGASAESALVLVRVDDLQGTTQQVVCGNVPGTLGESCEIAFDAGQSLSWAANWTVPNLPTGRYHLTLSLVRPGTISRSQPRGEVLAVAIVDADVLPVTLLGGNVSADPPVALPNTPGGISLAALLQNLGNADIGAGAVSLVLRNTATGAVVATLHGSLPLLHPSETSAVDFGTYQPTQSGQYALEVTGDDPTVHGVVLGDLYVGDAARGTMTVTPAVVGDGDQTVRATIDISALDAPTGAATDPLFQLVRAAVSKAGTYVGPSAKTWQQTHSCLGCHIQTQSLYGMASSIGKADIDLAQTQFLANSQSARVLANGSISSSGHVSTPSFLGLWSMSSWQATESSLPSRLSLAKYLYGIRKTNTDKVFWTTDQADGWWYNVYSVTATNLQSFAAILRDVDQRGSDRTTQYAAAGRVKLSSATYVDLASGPDDALYALSNVGDALRADPATNTASVYRRVPAGYAAQRLAIGSDGDVYFATSVGRVLRVSSTGLVSNLVVSTGGLVGIAVAADGTVYAVDSAGGVYAAAPGQAARKLFTVSSPRRLTLAADGSLHVLGNGAAWRWVDGSAPVAIHSGTLLSLTAIAMTPSGSTYLASSTGSGLAAVLVADDKSWIRPALYGSAPVALATRGEHAYALYSSYADPTLGTGPMVVEITNAPVSAEADVANLRAVMTPGARQLLAAGVGNNDISSDAYALVGLSEALPYVTDAALKAQMTTRINDLGVSLRARQRPDGGFPAFKSQTNSQPMTTAMVGLALDYLNPSASDPVLRKSVQYLLNTQQADGSWSSLSYLNQTRLGPTSFIMAYLPKAVARLGGIDVGLSMTFASSVNYVNPTLAPTTTTVAADGAVTYTYALGRVNSRTLSIGADLRLLGMQPTEVRPIARDAHLTFVNGFTGALMNAPIEIPSVRATNGYALALALNRTDFYANQTVQVQPTVSNNGSAYGNGKLRYFIETEAGQPVAQLADIGFDSLPSGSARSVPQDWGTGATFAGNYRARVELYGAQGTLLATATAPFRILAGSNGSDPQLTSSVTTDKLEYDPREVVTILGRLRSQSPNSTLTDLIVTETVTDPAGTVTFSATQSLAELLPLAVGTLTFGDALQGAPALTYTVTQVVTDLHGAVLDTRFATFKVRSSAVTGAGLAGTIVATPEAAETGQTIALTAQVKNNGNADFVALPVRIMVVAPSDQRVIKEWTQTIDLAQGSAAPLSASWDTSGQQAGAYAAVLVANVGGVDIALAFDDVTLTAPAIKVTSSQSFDGDNRVLVLMTCRIGTGASEDLACTQARATFTDQLLTSMGVVHKIVTSADSFRTELRFGRYNTYWISGGAVKLANPLAEEVREAVLRGDGLLVDGVHDSRNQVLDDALGVRYIGQLPRDAYTAVVGGPLFPNGSLPEEGDTLRYDVGSGRVQGAFARNGMPALVTAEFGAGRANVVAFDLIATLQKGATASYARSLLDAGLRYLVPVRSGPHPVSGYTNLVTTVHNIGRAADLDVEVTVAPGMSIETTAPSATATTAVSARWRISLDSGADAMLDAGIRLPAASGTYSITTTISVVQSNGSTRLLDTLHTSVSVRDAGDLVAPNATALQGLTLSSSSERATRDRLVAYLQQAGQQISAGTYEDAIGTLLKADDETRKISSVPMTTYRIAIADLIQIAESRWFGTRP